MEPSDICDTCWDGVVKHQFGILSAPVEQEDFLGPTTGGYAYRISGKALQTNAKQNCHWCAHLVEWCGSCFDLKTDKEEEVRVGKGTGVDGEQVFSVYVSDSIHWFGYIFTTEDDPGASLIPGRNL